MATKTIANLRTAGLAPASSDRASFPGTVMLDFELDGKKLAVAATDLVQFFEIPAYAGFVVDAVGITVIAPGTATGTMDFQLAGTDVTGCTGWLTDAAAGTELLKLATAANTVVNTGTATYLNLQQNTAALGIGRVRVRVFGTLMKSPSTQV